MKSYTLLFFIVVIGLTGCDYQQASSTPKTIGWLVETSAEDQAWGEKGYEGIKAIEEKYDTNVIVKENINTTSDTESAVDELAERGADIIFGHGNFYSQTFQNVHQSYPDIHFIYFNGEFSAENVTALNFSSGAMGFFAGMVAGDMTETGRVGLIAAYEWQPEVEGFYAGVMHQNPQAKVSMSYTNSWESVGRAKAIYDQMVLDGADVFYPAGDNFNLPIIKRAERDELYAIGYVEDQLKNAKNTVLTSTVQRVDHLYVQAIEQYINGDLKGKVMEYDFQEGAIELGEYSEVVDKEVITEVNEAVEVYKNTGKLPFN
ncbi:BMP family ABC transporter substrate-binding protein [Halobacillus sp. Marseille-Q1614]|uniref:BMP family ABC transporter substrate-binding protein n=1 Tax=Halobacillus sp. Marseille-Q1614 TaxID=2709134 RepID=UPI0020C56235|nr:BMP family ABC transporter substrate-binding protein [Halobacillus sp. Marseille-Q1614]